MPESIPAWDQNKYYCISLPNGIEVKVAVKEKILHLRVVTKAGKEVHFIDNMASTEKRPHVSYPSEATLAPGTSAGGVKRYDLTLDSEVITFDEEGSRP